MDDEKLDPHVGKYMDSFTTFCGFNLLSLMATMMHPDDRSAQAGMMKEFVEHWEKWQKKAIRTGANQFFHGEQMARDICKKFRELKNKPKRTRQEEQELTCVASWVAVLPPPDKKVDAEEMYCVQLRAIEKVATMAKGVLLQRFQDGGKHG